MSLSSREESSEKIALQVSVRQPAPDHIASQLVQIRLKLSKPLLTLSSDTRFQFLQLQYELVILSVLLASFSTEYGDNHHQNNGNENDDYGKNRHKVVDELELTIVHDSDHADTLPEVTDDNGDCERS